MLPSNLATRVLMSLKKKSKNSTFVGLPKNKGAKDMLNRKIVQEPRFNQGLVL